MEKQKGFTIIEIVVVVVIIAVVVAIGLGIAGHKPVANSHPAASASSSPPNTPQYGLKGVSISPKSYTSTDYTDFFKEAAARGKIITWAGNWTDLQNKGSAPYAIARLAKQYGLTPVIVVGWTQGSGQAFADAVGAFAKTCQPAYIGVGNEVNRLHDSSPADYKAFVPWFATAAKQVHAASSATKVFTVFQYEQLNGLRGGLFGGKNDQSSNDWSLLADFPDADAVGFTTYPYIIYQDPVDIPPSYYQAIKSHTALPYAFTEVGWPSGTEAAGYESTPAEQAAFVQRFGELSAANPPVFAVWPFLYDQHLRAPFKTISLVDTNGNPKPSYQAWWDLSFKP